MGKMKSQILLGVICAAFGFMISLQFKNLDSLVFKPSSKRAGDLIKEASNLKIQRDDLMNKLGEIEKKIGDLEKESANAGTAYSGFISEADKLRKLEGTTEVKGDGVIVTLNIMEGLEADEAEINYFYFFLLVIINELKSAQAEAISVNGERFTSRSSIIFTGTDVKIDGTLHDPYKTFKIYAIGNPDNLRSALTIMGGAAETSEKLKIDMQVVEEKDLTIPVSRTAVN